MTKADPVMTTPTVSTAEGESVTAVTQAEFGGPEVLAIARRSRPQAGVSEIVVRVMAAGINPTDTKHRAGQTWTGVPVPVLGWDVSGVVESVGPGVTIHQIGDEVFGMLPYPHGAGAYAELAVAPARTFAPKPAGLDHVLAAALPLSGLTAHQALVDTANLAPGQTVLVHAGAGGVGHLAIQIAKARGAEVVATVSVKNQDLARRLGADHVIDYRSTDFASVVRDVDVVLDTVGGETRRQSLQVVRAGGQVISLVGDETVVEDFGNAARLGVHLRFLVVEADHAGLRALATLVDDGQLIPHVTATYPLDQAAQAHRHVESGLAAGKCVLVVGADRGPRT
jgi:NADPH:quinone reductase-like Zn-dependent oxidoreductase